MSPIVGRGAEQAAIADAVSRTSSGSGALLLVGGPAGIGKTALADAAVAEARRAGLRVTRGYAVDDPGAPPLWPWRRVLPPDARDGSQRRPQLRDGDAASRFEFFVRCVEDLSLQASTPGLLVLLEDMHWADRLSVLLLKHVSTELANLRICLVATFRDAASGEFSAALPELLRTPSGRLVTLGGLSAAEIAEWLPDLIGRRDDTLAATAHERTGGNPLLVRLLAGAVGGAASGGEDVLVGRPQLRRLIADRAAVLPAEDRALIDAAAVLGERLSPNVLSRMVQLPGDRVQEALAGAVASGVLRETADGLRFEHALVRDAVYGEIPAGRRTALHAAAARALAAVGAPASSVAAHWHRADVPEAAQRCATFADLARGQAQEAMAFDDAVRFGELALQSSRAAGCDTAAQARLLLRLAECQMLANRLEAAVRSCTEAADLAEAAGRTDLLCQAALVVHGYGHPLVFEVIPGICARALQRVLPSEPATRARLLAQIAVAECERGDGRRGADLAAESLLEAERSGDATATIEALAARHLASTVPTRVVERLDLGRRAVELGGSAARPMAALWGHLWRADASLQLGNLLEFDRELAAIDRVATTRGSVLARWHDLRFRAVRAALVGDFAAAREADRAAFELASRVGDISLLGLSHAFAIHLAVVRGDPAELPARWPEILAAAPPIPLVNLSGVLAHALRGDRELAAAEFAPFRDLPRTYPVGVRWAGTMLHVGMAAVMVDDAEVAAAALDVLRPTAKYYAGDGSGAVFSQGANARLLGDLAATAGRLDEALTFYRDAVAMNARVGARPFVALSELGWARALAASRRSRDPVARRAVSELLAGARREFVRLDMPGGVAAADAFAAEAAAAGHPAAPLSPRECEVAELVAQALSNREIAARLFLSERTVETHVRSILTKLGFSTRTEIATWSLTR